MDAVEIEPLDLKGARVEHVHGKEYKIMPRYFRVMDGNLKAKGPWIMELSEKLVEEKDGRLHEATVVSVMLAPTRASTRMTGLTRQSITVQPGKKGRYKNLPHVHVTFREPNSKESKKTAGRGEREYLPKWLFAEFHNRLRLRETVQGKVKMKKKHSHLGKSHDVKQVIVFPKWDDQEFIRLFFMMRVFTADQGYGFIA